MPSQHSIQQLNEKFKDGAEIVSKVANGPATGPDSIVQTAGGPVRTLARLIADKDAEINDEASPIFETAAMSAALAEKWAAQEAGEVAPGLLSARQYAQGASASASSASDSATRAENAAGSVATTAVSSIDALRLIEKSKWLRAQVTGYYAVGDGGGGLYALDAADTTSADNGGTVIVAADGGRWKLVRAGTTVSIKQFGAIGAGDCTAAIAAALAASVTEGFVVYAPEGTYNHTGISVPNGSRFIGAGIGKSILRNTHTVNASVSVAYNDDMNFYTYWEFSGFTVSCATPKSPDQRGLSLDTCRHGVVRDVHVKDHWFNVYEKSSWSNLLENIHSTGGEYMWRIAAGSSTGGVPNTRINVNGDSCTYGIDCEVNGVSATIWDGGSIEGMAYWAVRWLGNTNRSVLFTGFNFEGNAAAGGYEIIVGDDAVASSGPSNIGFHTCQFNDRSGLARTCFALNRGTRFKLDNCMMMGFGRGADISSNFGAFHLSGNNGPAVFAATSDANTNIPFTGDVLGSRDSFCHAAGGKFTVSQISSDSNILESRRHTEAHPRFEIAADGALGWHAFNAAAADVKLARRAANCIGVDDDDVIRTGRGVTSARPSPPTVGAGSMWYDQTLSKPLWSDGTVWRDASGVEV